MMNHWTTVIVWWTVRHFGEKAHAVKIWIKISEFKISLKVYLKNFWRLLAKRENSYLKHFWELLASSLHGCACLCVWYQCSFISITHHSCHRTAFTWHCSMLFYHTLKWLIDRLTHHHHHHHHHHLYLTGSLNCDKTFLSATSTVRPVTSMLLTKCLQHQTQKVHKHTLLTIIIQVFTWIGWSFLFSFFIVPHLCILSVQKIHRCTENMRPYLKTKTVSTFSWQWKLSMDNDGLRRLPVQLAVRHSCIFRIRNQNLSTH